MIDNYNTLAERFLRKGFWLYLFSFIIAPIGYIIKIIISGELSVEEVGLLYGVISLITIIGAFNDFGITESLKYFIPKFYEEKQFQKIKSIIAYSFLSQLITSILLTIIFFFGADFLASNYFKSQDAILVIKVFSLFFIGINIFQIITTFLLSIQDTFYSKLIEFIRFLFSLIFILLIFISDLGNIGVYSWGWIIGLYLGLITGLIIFYKKYYKKYFKNLKILWSKDLFKETFRYAIFVFLGAQAGMILSQIDMQMIIIILGTTDAGFYTVYLSIISIAFLFATPLLGFLLPVFSQISGDKKEILKIKKDLFNIFIIVGIMLSAFFFVFSNYLTFILFGENFLKSSEILKYSILFIIFNFLLQINFNILASIGKIKERVKILSIAIIINIILNFIFLKYLGVVGASLATGIGWLIIFVLSEFRLRKDYFIKINIYYLIRNLASFFILSALIYFFLLKYFHSLGKFYLLLSIIIFFIIYSVLFFITNKQLLIKTYNQVKIKK